MTRTGQAPFPYFGGKQQMAPLIVSLMPPHDAYVEVFGGAGAVLFAKPPSKLETYNDIDSGLVTFFRVLRNAKMSKELSRLLDLTPYAREEWNECRRTWQDAPTDVEMARRWFVLAHQSFAGKLAASGNGGSGWRHSTLSSHNAAQSYRSAINRIADFTKRLRHVQIEHLDFAHCITAYDGPDVLFYCDPPYLPDTRRGGGYFQEMDEDAHRLLLRLLCDAQGMVMLSGYDNPIYQELLQGWERVSVTVACSAVGRTRTSKLRGKGSVYSAGQTRTECLWLNPACMRRQISLFPWTAPTVASDCEASA